MKILSAFIAGLVFGFGLLVSEMVNPARVQGFLNLFGDWDPTLVFVMGGALVVTLIGYRLSQNQQKPKFSTDFSLPSNTTIDGKLLTGAILFGAGWGLGGLCPGPAIAGLAALHSDSIIFVIAMIVGMKGYSLFFETK